MFYASPENQQKMTCAPSHKNRLVMLQAFNSQRLTLFFYFVTVLFIKMSPKKFRTKKRAVGKKGLRKLLNNLKNKK